MYICSNPYLMTWRPSDHPSQRFKGAWLEHARRLKKGHHGKALFLGC